MELQSFAVSPGNGGMAGSGLLDPSLRKCGLWRCYIVEGVATTTRNAEHISATPQSRFDLGAKLHYLLSGYIRSMKGWNSSYPQSPMDSGGEQMPKKYKSPIKLGPLPCLTWP